MYNVDIWNLLKAMSDDIFQINFQSIKYAVNLMINYFDTQTEYKINVL